MWGNKTTNMLWIEYSLAPADVGFFGSRWRRCVSCFPVHQNWFARRFLSNSRLRSSSIIKNATGSSFLIDINCTVSRTHREKVRILPPEASKERINLRIAIVSSMALFLGRIFFETGTWVRFLSFLFAAFFYREEFVEVPVFQEGSLVNVFPSLA